MPTAGIDGHYRSFIRTHNMTSLTAGDDLHKGHLQDCVILCLLVQTVCSAKPHSCYSGDPILSRNIALICELLGVYVVRVIKTDVFFA